MIILGNARNEAQFASGRAIAKTYLIFIKSESCFRCEKKMQKMYSDDDDVEWHSMTK